MGRRTNRYLRRQEKRKKKKQELINNKYNYETAIQYSSLYKSANLSAKGVRWKASVQKYLLNMFPNIVRAKKSLSEGNDKRRGYVEFDIYERGKPRHIRSVYFEDRVKEKSISRFAILPILSHSLIYDNGASQKGKGMHFAHKRLVKMLADYYRRYGNEGYILLIDFKGYFDNINHDKLKQFVNINFEDDRLVKYHNDFVDSFGNIGLGLGSEISQIDAIYYANKIDHFIKEKLGIKAYGRYMDDSYIINPSKDVLKSILVTLRIKFNEVGIILNPKKTHIRKLSNGFTFLKTRFYITETGEIVRKASRESITRQRRKLKRQKNLNDKNLLSYDGIYKSFISWIGSMLHRNARSSIHNMLILFNKLFEKGVKL